MKKLFLIGWKDVTLVFRDRTALLLMLAAPFLLTLGLGFVTGRFAGSSSNGLSQIPVVVVDQDGGQLGSGLVSLLQSPDLANLLAVATLGDPDAARRQVDADQVAAAVIIPSGFTTSVIPAQGAAASGPLVQVELVANPTRPTGAGVIRAILDEYMSQVEVGRVGATVAINGLLRQGLIQPQDAVRLGAEIGARQAAAVQSAPAITIRGVASGSTPVSFDPLAYMAPGMALMFLMFTVTNGGRSLLAEKNLGTLPRLLAAPVSTGQVLGGKVLGTYLTGVAQMVILVGASAALFGLNWGSLLAVLALVLAAVAGAVGWGTLIIALARTPGQVSWIGTALMLTFGILGGSFINVSSMPAWFQVISKITPNAWGLDGFSLLASGGQLNELLMPVAALLGMGLVLFVLSAGILNRRGWTVR